MKIHWKPRQRPQLKGVLIAWERERRGAPPRMSCTAALCAQNRLWQCGAIVEKERTVSNHTAVKRRGSCVTPYREPHRVTERTSASQTQPSIPEHTCHVLQGNVTTAGWTCPQHPSTSQDSMCHGWDLCASLDLRTKTHTPFTITINCCRSCCRKTAQLEP